MYCDAYGQQHERAADAARIVSLVPSITELLCTLQLETQLIGRTGFCIHPRETVQNIAKLGGTKDVDIEALKALQPSHVIVNIDENTRPLFETLRECVPHVVVTHPNAPRDNIELFRLLGGIFNREQAAASLAEQFSSRLYALEQRAPSASPQKVLYLIWREPWMSVSADTYIARMLALINWQVVQCRSSARYPEIGGDELRSCSAERVLLSSEPYPFRNKHIIELRSLCGNARVVQHVDGEMLSWYGSRAIAGLDYLAQLADQVEDAVA